ncbi:helix-turn-helix domain-containing protein [Gordonia amicalis]|uniref:helix-turn-helix transcriptional regulator n=1 Tax=Gordonia amicalis TaxID=89053 RepID=UPI001EDEC584|nr:helix-turn-helix domain-containing protein [Gordonia amicalis]MDV7173441.1 helix-turn-helix domain-containing protein [Gordonia amicalis]UKO93915.1 helix-turn-helix domain-containing protein [Gordonia amicalis]UOG21530.1 helix-turn-helix domain-containing protein [Gordonia amicalis]
MGTLTMQDVADLARVSRPAVSQWRKRTIVHGESMPFPPPVATIGGVEHFDEQEIVAWLQRTRRGKNRDEQHLDVGAVAVPHGIRYDDVICLLALYAISGVELSTATAESLIEVATEADPDDLSILREIRALDASDDLLHFTEQLIDASLGTPDALDRLEKGRLGRSRGVRDLKREGFEVVRSIVGALLSHLDADGVSIVPAGDPTLALACVNAEEQCAIGAHVADIRNLRRRAAICRIELIDTAPDRSVTVASFVGSPVAGALDAVDGIVLDLRDGEVAVVMASAAALTDHLAGDLQVRRSETLKIGNVVCALRLPRGLWRQAHRQSQALWICQGGTEADHVAVADLDTVGSADLGDVAADVSAVLDQNPGRAHRFVRRRDLLGIRASGTVVPRGTSAPKLRSRAQDTHTDRVHRATLETSAPIRTVDVLIAPASGRFRTQDHSLAELVERKMVTVKGGSRIDPRDADDAGTVRVLPDDVLRLDPFDAARRYPRARRTEPGDIVFVEKPAPRAVVDPVGGSLVGAPAKLLRIDQRAPLRPNVLAAVINTRCEAGSEWQTWRIPGFTAEESQQLEKALAEIADYQRAVEAKAAAAKDLALALIDGVAAGDISLDANETTPGISAVTTTVSTE